MGGTQTQKTKSEPWGGVADQLHNAAVAADRGYNAAREAGAPGIDPTTQMSWGSLFNQATDPNSLLGKSLGLAGQTVGGDFLNANPYISQAYQGAAQDATRAYSSAVDPAMRQYQSQMDNTLSQYKNAIAPGIDAQFIGAGRAGSGLLANAQNEGRENVARQFNDAQSNMSQYLADSNNALARNLTNMGGQMYYQNYGDERARQNAAMSTAPGLSTLQGGILGQIGSEKEGRQTASNEHLLDLAGRYNSALSGFAGIEGKSKTSGGGQNPWMQALGMGLNGLQTYAGMGGFK
jgi:hypothetical protein